MSRLNNFIDWVRGFDADEDLPDIFEKLERLDRFETMVLDGATVEEIRAVLFELEDGR